jgi:tRNA(His) 5'-end guanylyltransferase
MKEGDKLPKYDEIGKRMKTYYEQIPKIKLMRRCPVIIRIDQKCGHSFTKGFDKPFDAIYVQAMQETMRCLCEEVQNASLGYTQSDEISLLLIDYKNLNSEAYFDYEVQKLCSVIASKATRHFNKIFRNLVNNYNNIHYDLDEDFTKKCNLYRSRCDEAEFDCRCFNIPENDCTNYFYWRQIDAIRNSINMVGQANFSAKELHGKSCNMVQKMLLDKGINWDEFNTYLKRGSCCIKTDVGWIIDKGIPEFVGEGRDYIDKLVFINE